MIRVYQDKNNLQERVKKFIIEEDFVVVGGGEMVFGNGYATIVGAKVNEGLAFNYYDLLIRSMLNSVRDAGDLEIRIYCFCHCEQSEESGLYKKLGFVKQNDYYAVKAKNINFKGCNN